MIFRPWVEVVTFPCMFMQVSGLCFDERLFADMHQLQVFRLVETCTSADQYDILVFVHLCSGWNGGSVAAPFTYQS